MHEPVRLYVEDHAELIHGSALEIGCLGDGAIRAIVEPRATYLGMDLRDGPNVDKVCATRDLLGQQYDTILCLEVLEHDDRFWVTLDHIRRLLAPSGVLFLSARGATVDGRAMYEHNYPGDFWRFMPQSVPMLFALAGTTGGEWHEDEMHPGFMGWGERNR